MRTLFFSCVFLGLSLGSAAEAREVSAGDLIGIQDMTLMIPEGWSLRQDAKDEDSIILGFEKGAAYLTVFVRQLPVDMRAMFINGSVIVRDVRSQPRNNFDWKILETSKGKSGGATHYIASFSTIYDSNSYFGYSRGASSQEALENVNLFLQNLRQK